MFKMQLTFIFLVACATACFVGNGVEGYPAAFRFEFFDNHCSKDIYDDMPCPPCFICNEENKCEYACQHDDARGYMGEESTSELFEYRNVFE